MPETQNNQSDGYRVFVRTISGIVVLACVMFAVFRYCFRVAISQSYAPESDNTDDLILIGLALSVACHFALSIWQGKFLWFVGNEKQNT